MSRRAPRLAVVLAAVLSLAGCATIPMTGDVMTPNHPVVTDAPQFVIVPNGPMQGDSPQQIVAGFVTAQQGQSYGVAREFLTDDFARTWNPATRVLVHDEAWSTSSTSSTGARLEVPTTARLDANGRYSSSSQSTELDFGLKLVGGQWRISSAPNGIVLPTQIFQRTYAPESLQYFSPDYRRLVPDLRWFPLRATQASTLPRTIVAGLLGGQASPLVGATVSAFPSGTRLAASPTIVEGVTEVAVTTPGVDPNATAETRMYQQLARSLQITSTSQLQLTVDGRLAQSDLLDATQPDPRPAVVIGDRFGLLSSSGLSGETAIGRRIVALRPSEVTVSSNLAAVLNASGVVVVRDDGQKVVDTRAGLAAPTLDQSGWVYSIPKDDPGGLQAYDRTGKSADLHVTLPGDAVTAIEVSRDGTRLLALVTTDAGESRVVVAGIVRAASGMPVSLTAAHYEIDLGDVSAKDATWQDDGSIAVLTVAASNQEQIVSAQLGGPTTALGAVANVASIVGGATAADLRARLVTGDIWVSRGTAWGPEFATTIDSSVLAVQR